MLDLNNIGIGAIVGATIVTTANIFLHQRNLKLDRSKEQLKNLYNPLNAIIQMRKKHLDFLRIDSNNFEKFASEYYQFFLDLRKIYLENEVYASLELRTAFHTLNHNHEVEVYNHRIYKNLTESDEVNKRISLFELERKTNEDEQSEFEENIEKVINVIINDMNDLYAHKLVSRYFKK
ncbi:MAG: Unknown protein [uncultured Sulfurovum sp.]|uniref:Uncharacterized protein n=1 Tax=uncultured Sulfurovum sp. TaxID=269237 RepID=A0A6S6TT99_9BACT|nr:MAG: Unknown protein [uncultured Sulfurovum sp.]